MERLHIERTGDRQDQVFEQETAAKKPQQPALPASMTDTPNQTWLAWAEANTQGTNSAPTASEPRHDALSRAAYKQLAATSEYWKSENVSAATLVEKNPSAEYGYSYVPLCHATAHPKHKELANIEYMKMVKYDTIKPKKVIGMKVVKLQDKQEAEADGWVMWKHPARPTQGKDEKDTRALTRLEDVKSHDQPWKDAAEEFQEGIQLAAAAGSTFTPGHGALLGKQAPGLLPEHQSISYRPDHILPGSEPQDRRCANTTLLPKHKRPDEAGLGRGQYDKFAPWREAGRLVKESMLSKEESLPDTEGKLRFVAPRASGGQTMYEYQPKRNGWTSAADSEDDEPAPMTLRDKAFTKPKQQKEAHRGGRGGHGGRA